MWEKNITQSFNISEYQDFKIIPKGLKVYLIENILYYVIY